MVDDQPPISGPGTLWQQRCSPKPAIAPAHRAVGRSRSGSWSTTRTVIWFCGERSPGHYVDVDEAAHVSEAGAAKGWRTGALIGFLLGPPGFAVGSVVGAAAGSQEGEPGERDREPTLLVDKLRAAVPAPGSGVVLVADAGDVDEMLSAFALGDARVTHRTLSAEDLAVVNAALSEALAAASAPPGLGEAAVELLYPSQP